MKLTNLFKILPLAAASLGLGLSGNVQAGAYAISLDELTDGFFISNNFANTFGTPVNTSADSATHSNVATNQTQGDVGTGLRNALMEFGGFNAGEDNYTQVGPLGIDWVRGDAAIFQEQFGVNPGEGIVAANVAEAELANNGSAEARGNNSSGTLFNVNLIVVAPGTATFQFTFDPFMQVILHPEALPGSLAQAIITASLTITDTVTGTSVFTWSPDGTVQGAAGVGGTIGGIETADGFDLQTILSQFVPGQQTFDPAAGFFEATTAALPVGVYNVTAEMSERVSITATKTMPEPSTMALMGMGLVGLGFMRRRRSKLPA